MSLLSDTHIARILALPPERKTELDDRILQEVETYQESFTPFTSYEDQEKELNKRYDDMVSLFEDLDTTRSDSNIEFQNAFNDLNSTVQKKYLWHLHDKGELSKEEYKEQVDDVYLQEFKENSAQGNYAGYVPFEYEGKVLYVKGSQFDPNRSTQDPMDFVRNSILPNDIFYFPESVSDEKEWLVGKPTDYGQIEYVDLATSLVGTEGEFEDSPSARANDLLSPERTGLQMIAPLVQIAGMVTGNPLLSSAGAVAAGGDLEDVVKSVAIGKITAPILENTIADLGVDADLFGMDADKFSESMMDVQATVLKGGDIEKSLIKEFGIPAVKQIAGAFGDALPDVDFETPQILKDLEDVVKLGVDPIVDVAQKGIDVVQTVTQPISDVTSDIEDIAKEAGREFDETVLQPVKEGVQAVTEPVVDVIDDIIDAVDSPIGDVLQAGGNLIQGMLGGVVGGQQPQTVSRTPVENIFDKELFKFDTEIKSTQEMLSPMMNLRRYG